MLKNAQLSIEKFEEICEVALLEAELNQTDVRKQTLMSENHTSLIGNKYTGRKDKDILIIKTRNIIAKYGIDLSDVKVFESEEKLQKHSPAGRLTTYFLTSLLYSAIASS